MKFKQIKEKAGLYASKRRIKKGETFRMIHANDFIAGYKQALEDLKLNTKN